MLNYLKRFALVTTLSLSLAAPAGAQSVDEMSFKELKALMLKMQKRIDQLEAAQRRPPAPARRARIAERPASAAQGAAAGQTRAAQQAAAQAQQSAIEAREAAAQAQQAQARAQQDARLSKETAAAEVKAAFAPPPGQPGGSFRIPGSNTTVRIYGFAKLNVISDLTTHYRSDAITSQSIPLFGTSAQHIGGDTQVSARRSRIDVEIWTPVNDMFGEFHTLFEMDFAGQNTSLITQSTANAYTPRLRKFYADFGKPVDGWGALLFGQESSVFSDNSLLPIQWLNDIAFVGVSNIRQGQIRYTYGFGGGLALALGIESPYSDVTTATGTSYPDSNGGAGVGWQQSPDITGRLLWKQDWGLIALRGLLRPQINLNNKGATDADARFNKSITGYGVGVTGVLNLLDRRLVLMASGNAGNGLGRYLDTTANGYSAVSNAGLTDITAENTNLDGVAVYAGMVGLQYFLTPTIRTNMAIGGARLMSYPSYVSQFGGCVDASVTSGTCSSTNKTMWEASVNLIWSPFKAVDIGLEYLHAERILQSPFATSSSAATTGGILNRIEASLIERF